ncbi:MAG TPA: site-specific integrase [Phycisphaerae bacterium]|nr:site-specific integrase [Phycisphaerae bacterium]HSA29707.1 site-specific integrase [Phycisphaerae bacterium]
MATEKVGVYRKYHGPVPMDESGSPLPRSEWPRRRAFRWAVRWFGSDGKRYSRSFESRREADQFAESTQAAMRVGKADQPQAVTMAEFADMYLELRGDLAPMSRLEHAHALRLLGECLGNDQVVSRVSSLDARRFLAWYRERMHRGRTPTPATVNKILRECHRIFREAVACSLIRENPFAGLRQEKVGQRSWHCLSPAEYRKLIEVSPSLRWRGMITLGYCCGLRLGEVLNLTWCDVDFERGQVRVARKCASGARLAWTPKDKDMRIVPLPSQAVSILAELQLTATDGQEYVFVCGKGTAQGSRLKRHNLWRDFQAIRTRAGLPKCSFHDLRKSYCTNLAGAVPLHVVQELAGHADIRTTRRHYLKVRDEQIDSARRALEEVMRA